MNYVQNAFALVLWYKRQSLQHNTCMSLENSPIKIVPKNGRKSLITILELKTNDKTEDPHPYKITLPGKIVNLCKSFIIMFWYDVFKIQSIQ